MSDLLQKEILKEVNELFLQAEEEERKYNWDNAIELLKKAEEISLYNKLKKMEGEIYYKLGEIYQIVAEFKKTEKSVLNSYQLSIINFQKAHNTFKELRIEEKISSALGFINLLKYINGSETENEENFLESAKKNFNKAEQIYQQNGNLIESLKMAILGNRSSILYIADNLIRLDKDLDFRNLISEHMKSSIDLCLKIVKNSKDLSEIYLYQFIYVLMENVTYISVYSSMDRFTIEDFLSNLQKRVIEFISNLESSTKIMSLKLSHLVNALCHFLYFAYHSESQFEQKKYLKRAQTSIQSAESLFLEKNSNIYWTLFYYIRFTVAIGLTSLGFFTEDFKQIYNDFNKSNEYGTLCFPKILIAHAMLMNSLTFIAGFISSIPDIQRIDLAQRNLNFIEGFVSKKISIVDDPDYKLFKIYKNAELAITHATLGSLIADPNEKLMHYKVASNLFNELSNYSYKELTKSKLSFLILVNIVYTGNELGKISSENTEKDNFYQKTIKILTQIKEQLFNYQTIENLFLLGDLYRELGILKNDNQSFGKASKSYIDAIEFCKNNGFFNLVGFAYCKIAQIEDRQGNFHSAAGNYQLAIKAFEQAVEIITIPRINKRIENLKQYMKAWNIIELAKTFHVKEEHQNAQLKYEQASQILKNIRDYRYESPFYSAWAILETAEDLSKKNNHEEAAKTYLTANKNFQNAVEFLKNSLKKKKSPEGKVKISKLIKVAEVRERYCTARNQIETARLESKKGNHFQAAELYHKAGFLFEKICQKFRIERERNDLTAILYLCKAWENMEMGELKQNYSLFATASDLFKKASIYFPESRMKKLSIGNAFFCSALENRSLFDKSTELEEKISFYRKIKMFLRESSKNYQLGGFEEDAKWALATSTFFDGIWHLIQSDNELDFSKKNQFLGTAINYLNTAMKIFDDVGSKKKKEEIIKYLEMIKKEKEILTSASVIEKPAISNSSVGISAPSCPIEISSSVNMEEMQRTDLQTESEVNWHKRIRHICVFMPNGTCIYDHPFKLEEGIEPHFVAGGLTGISMLIQEMTKKETKIKIVEQEDMTIMLEHGKYVSIALITEENLITLRKKLEQLIQEVEDFFQEELESYSGNLTPFSKVGKFIQKIFEK